MVSASPPPPHIKVRCQRFEEVEGHVDYIFDVEHGSGETWDVRWRFSELLAADAGLRRTHRELPPFPPRGPPGISIVLGNEAIAQRRSVVLQRYFEEVLASPEAEHLPGLYSLLGMRPPEAVATAQVLSWLPSDAASSTAACVLAVALGPSAACAPVEEISVAAWLLAGAEPVVSRGPAGEPLHVTGLPCGELLSLEVFAGNRAGVSPAFALQLTVPGERTRSLAPGARVRAVWAGDGAVYDAVVKNLTSDDTVVLNWLRPMPLSAEKLRCVCDAGGDDTTHRMVPRGLVSPLASDPEELLPDSPLASPVAAASPIVAAPNGGEPYFSLTVRLDQGEGVRDLRWQSLGDLERCIDAFMAATHLKPIFREPLQQEVELMVQEDRRIHTVDIVDLL